VLRVLFPREPSRSFFFHPLRKNYFFISFSFDFISCFSTFLFFIIIVVVVVASLFPGVSPYQPSVYFFCRLHETFDTPIIG
jgi:hypothetical protein